MYLISRRRDFDNLKFLTRSNLRQKPVLCVGYKVVVISILIIIIYFLKKIIIIIYIYIEYYY
jgi:hypothetical protein